MKTRVILREDIPTLGNVGEVVEVAAGYARNHLIPSGRAFAYSKDGMRRVDKDRKIAEAKRLAEMAEFEALAQRLGSVQLTFEEAASEEGHLYGSVNAHRIAAELAAQGMEVAERSIRLAEPLRETGEYEVAIHIHAEVEARIKIWVVRKQEPEG